MLSDVKRGLWPSGICLSVCVCVCVVCRAVPGWALLSLPLPCKFGTLSHQLGVPLLWCRWQHATGMDELSLYQPLHVLPVREPCQIQIPRPVEAPQRRKGRTILLSEIYKTIQNIITSPNNRLKHTILQWRSTVASTALWVAPWCSQRTASFHPPLGTLTSIQNLGGSWFLTASIDLHSNYDNFLEDFLQPIRALAAWTDMLSTQSKDQRMNLVLKVEATAS